MSTLRTAKLIADSGSTKAHWILIDGTSIVFEFHTRGMNPVFRSAEDIFLELQEKILAVDTRAVGEIFFYGSGVVDESKGNIIKEVLRRIFTEASIEAHSDILGAARGLFGHKAGISCILGTGSNVCLYDGDKIVGKVPPLGFILGDEGSGGVMGRKLIGDYFKRIMPQGVRRQFEEEFDVDLVDIINRVYRAERPNKFLAGFTPFLSAHLDEPYCRQLVMDSLNEFFKRNVLQLAEAQGYPIGFVGSVSFHFQGLVEEVSKSHGFGTPKIMKDPVTGLVNYHK